VGIEVHRIHWQSRSVAESIQGFMINFAEAVIIVLVILTIGMGWRLAVIIGTALVATILGSFLLMSIFGIDLQRMSLGALIIALGMMVDNAIVVADGYVVRLKSGMDRVKAATEAGTMPSIPLLGATIVAVMAFYPISASDESAGEYTATLFSVVAIALLVSWLVSVTVTPVQCMDMLKDAGNGQDDDPYSKGFYLKFRNFLVKAIKARYLTIGVMVVLLVISVIGFGYVNKLFFPDSSMPKLMIDYWAPQGTRIEKTSADLAKLEAYLSKDDRIDSVATFVGSGPPRFYLPVSPESPYSSYGQLVVNVHDYKQISNLISELGPWVAENFPDAQIPIRRFGVGPSDTWKFEVRISGPAVADADILRGLAGQVGDILKNSPLAGLQQNDWRNRVLTMVPEYSQVRARLAGISRDDIASTTKRAYDGRPIGLYREQDNMIPIVLRNVNEERQQVGAMDTLQVQSLISTERIPLSQVTNGIKPVWEDPEIWRRDRRRTITVQANPIEGATLLQLRATVVKQVEALKIPPGYILEWGGEYENSTKASASLLPGMIPAGVLISLIVVSLFNAYKPPLVILLTVPFALIGITSGMLATGAAFGFVAILGALSLVGMMIKNAIVLLDEVNINLDKGKDRYDAIILAALSRLRPVVLAAATTVLGVAPLLQDVFWIGLAVTVMAGLAFGTLLTMIMVPVFYATVYKIKSP
ncbi:MAG TPA: efflux RND transporter permease subunit, partial [Gammaproteobacteria bacterium]|nr:efflux RND transporter permease subunit [Gammaproteobacteria bacterium]